jgi:hypothetical protein
MNTEHPHRQSSPGPSRFNWGLAGAIAVIAYFLISEHRAHFIQYLPFLLLLACPLLHLFMHGGHGGHGDHGDSGKDGVPADKNAKGK